MKMKVPARSVVPNAWVAPEGEKIFVLCAKILKFSMNEAIVFVQQESLDQIAKAQYFFQNKNNLVRWKLQEL